MASLDRLPLELQVAIIEGGLEPTTLGLPPDEREAVVANKRYCREIARVNRTWNAIATPLLYAELTLDDPAWFSSDGEDEDYFNFEPPSSVLNTPYRIVQRQAALLRTLARRPDLAALVRTFHHSNGRGEDSQVPDAVLVGAYDLLPNLTATSTLRNFGLAPPKPFAGRLTSLRVEVTPTSGAPLRPMPLICFFDLSALVRLDLSVVYPSMATLLNLAPDWHMLPALVDLRVSVQLRGEDTEYAADGSRRPRHWRIATFLETHGVQLKVFHCFTKWLDARQPKHSLSFDLDVPTLCPNLEELGINPWQTHIQPSTSGRSKHIKWDRLKLKRLVLGDPAREQVRCGRKALAKVARSGRAHATIECLQPETVVVTRYDAAQWTSQKERDAVRSFAVKLQHDGRQVGLQDRYGRVVGLPEPPLFTAGVLERSLASLRPAQPRVTTDNASRVRSRLPLDGNPFLTNATLDSILSATATGPASDPDLSLE